MSDSSACLVYDEDDESIHHLFRFCGRAKEVWRRTLSPVKFDSRDWTRTADWIKENCKINEKLYDGITWNTKFVYTLWGLWKTRNDLAFNINRKDAQVVVDIATRLSLEADSILGKKALVEGGKAEWISWSLPEEGWVKLNTDGAYKSRYKLASAGGLIRDHNGCWITGFKMKIGTVDSFLAELWGLR